MATTVPPSPERAERVELLLSQLDNLPTLPAVATRLLQLTTASDSSAREVIRLIESDQSLATKILSLPRRASAGASRNVNTVERAVIFLGFDAVRNACLSIKVFEVFARRGEPTETAFDRGEFWKHSLAVACAAQLVAEQLRGGVEPEQAFVCGLLHDIGKVALDSCLPKSFDRVVRRANSARACIADVEREFLGVDHSVVGHRLAQRWRLPQSITECIWLHHHGPDALPTSVQNADLVRIVHLADRIAREHRIGYSGNHQKGAPISAMAARLGLDAKACEKVNAQLGARIEERANLIGLDELTSQDLYMKALADANAELSRINTDLADANCRLGVRSRYFQAMDSMNQRLVRSVSHGEATTAAAEAVKLALQVPAAVFYHSAATGLVHVGLSSRGESGRERACTWHINDLTSPPSLSAGVSGHPTPVTFLPAATVVPSLYERVQAECGEEMPWLYPLLQDETGTAGVLLGGGADAATAWTRESDELAALLTAIRLWLAATESQQQALRLNEGLSDVNRRLQQVQDEAARARSLSMIAEMAAGAAHELNNPLAVISGRSQMLKDTANDESIARVATVLAEQSQRCSQIVAELMEFAKPAPPQKRPISVGTLLERVRETWLERSSLAPEQFVLELSDELPTIDVDAPQVQSAIDEFVRNAMDATENRSVRIVVNCHWDRTDEWVVIRVEDNGCGMSPETLERAIDPFFSHRSAGRGRGLGLSRAARWIEINGGRLRIDSRAGEGTTVFAEFPVSTAASGA